MYQGYFENHRSMVCTDHKFVDLSTTFYTNIEAIAKVCITSGLCLDILGAILFYSFAISANVEHCGTNLNEQHHLAGTSFTSALPTHSIQTMHVCSNTVLLYFS